MSVVLQAYIGAIPLFIGLIIYLIKKKKYVLPMILFAVQVLFATFMIALEMPKPMSEIEAIDVYESYKHMADGELNQARDVINEAFENVADKYEITVAKARLCVLEGSLDAAVVLYEKVMEHNAELLTNEEADFVRSIREGAMMTATELSYQASNIHYLKEQGLNPVEFGFANLTDEKIEENVTYLDNFQKSIVPSFIEEQVKEMEEEYEILAEIEDINKVVEVVMSHNFNSYIGVPITNPPSDSIIDYEGSHNNGGENVEAGEKADVNQYAFLEEKKLHNLMEEYKDKYPELFDEGKYAEAYIFSVALAGKPLDNVLKEASSDQYEIISNMYISGIITEDNFTKEFALEYKNEYKEVLKQCQQIAIDLSKEQDIEKTYVNGQSVKEFLDELGSQDNFALQQLAQDMDGIVDDDKVPNDKLSEIYMTMSVVADRIGDNDKSTEYFNEAVMNSDKSSDKDYAQVLGEIKNAYTEGGEDLDYIQTAENVSNMYQNNFHFDIVSNDVKENVTGIAGTAISETFARVSIGKVDVSEFSKLSVSIQYAGDVELTDDIMVLKDCGIEIEDYSIEKRQYAGSKVLLMCDMSGSMRGNETQLTEAVTKYVKSMGANEEVCIVIFSDKVNASSGFTSNKEQLIEFAKNEMYVRGGTTICEATYECLQHFADNNIANTLIVMTDGEDCGRYTEADMKERIGGLSNENNVTIYTIGLGGSITPPFLQKLADVGGGKFLYCSNESELESAYDFIHGRINNEYIIKFEAEDLDSLSRVIEITVDDGNMEFSAKDSKTYLLKSESTEENPNVEFSSDLPENVTIKGLDVNRIDKSTERQLLNVLGSGFTKAKITNVYLQSTKGQSNCKIKEIKDGSVTFQVAPSVGEGTYSVFITMDNKKYKVDTLVIGNASATELVFGAYHFTADKIEKYDDKVVMSGNVVLNDYLYFMDSVTLQGNVYRDSSVKLHSNGAGYVHHDMSAYKGIDKILLPIRSKTKAFDYLLVDIYDDVEHYNDFENYKVEKPWESKIGQIDLGIISLEDNTINLYPDRVMVRSSAGVMKDNPITDMLTNGVDFFKLEDDMPYIKGEVENEARLMKEGPFTYFNMDIEAGLEGSSFKIADFLSIEGKAGVKVMFDTYNREIELGVTLSTEASDDAEPTKLNNSDTTVLENGDAGLLVSIKGEEGNKRYGDKFLNIEVAFPLDLTFSVYGVPVTLTDIKASLNNYNVTKAIDNLTSGAVFTSSLKQYVTNKEGADLKVSGNIELVSTNALPKKASKVVEELLGDDVSLLELEELYGSVGINYPHFGAGAKLNLLGCVELASIDMEFGAISYPNYIDELLNISDGKKHYGFTFTADKGVKFDWDAVGANVSGTVSAVTTVDRFLVSAYVKGTVAANAKVNLFGTGFKVDGEAKTEACAAVWEKDDDLVVNATIVASVDGTANLSVFGIDIVEKEVHEKVTILDY